ncbi:TPA: YHS domain-containing protein [Methanosarcina acetivorans]|nr:YHS domain-containing protein [Methanosarcina acetivorans]
MIQIDPICGMPVDTEKAQFKAEIRGGTYYFCNEEHKRSFLENPRIAYFSMEVGLKNEMPTCIYHRFSSPCTGLSIVDSRY